MSRRPVPVLVALIVGLAPTAPVRGEVATAGAVRVSGRLDSDGRHNPLTNELSYPELHVAYDRAVTSMLDWQLGAGLGGIVGAETDGMTAQLGVGASVRTRGELFLGAHLELGWSYNRYSYADTTCETHGPVGRGTVEAGLRFGPHRALVVSGGVRARALAIVVCSDGEERDPGELNVGPAVGLSYEWKL